MTAEEWGIRMTEIAEMLINEYCISNGAHSYEIAELEFYLHHPNPAIDDASVYLREGKHAGDLFFHYSGFDVCFESEGLNIFGGILIRAVREISNGNRAIIGGPLVCLNEILNTATIIPHLERKAQATNVKIAAPTTRIGITTDQRKWRFYRPKMEGLEPRKVLKRVKEKGEMVIKSVPTKEYCWYKDQQAIDSDNAKKAKV